MYHCPSFLSYFTGSGVGVWGSTVNRSNKIVTSNNITRPWILPSPTTCTYATSKNLVEHHTCTKRLIGTHQNNNLFLNNLHMISLRIFLKQTVHSHSDTVIFTFFMRDTCCCRQLTTVNALGLFYGNLY